MRVRLSDTRGRHEAVAYRHTGKSEHESEEIK